MGGIFGDTVLIFILENTKFEINETLRFTSLIFGILSLFFICIISAINKKEFYKITNTLFSSFIEGIKLLYHFVSILTKSKRIVQISNLRSALIAVLLSDLV